MTDKKSYYSVEDPKGDLIMSVRASDGDSAKELVAEQTGYGYDDLHLPTEDKAEYAYGITD